MAFPSNFGCPSPLALTSCGRCLHCTTGNGKGRVEKNWQMRASKVLQNSMFSFLSNFNLSLTSLRSFPAGLAWLCTCPVLQRPGTRCFWWYSPLRSGISIPSCCDNTSPWKYFSNSLADAKANTNPRCWRCQKVPVALWPLWPPEMWMHIHRGGWTCAMDQPITGTNGIFLVG